MTAKKNVFLIFLIIQRSDSLDNVDADYGITDNKIWVIMKV